MGGGGARGAGPGGWGQEGRFPDARPQQGPPGPRPRRTRAWPAGGPDPAGSAQGVCVCVGRGVVVSAQSSRLETEARRIELRGGGGRAPGGIDMGRGQEGVRGRGGRGRGETPGEKETRNGETQREKQTPTWRERHTQGDLERVRQGRERRSWKDRQSSYANSRGAWGPGIPGEAGKEPLVLKQIMALLIVSSGPGTVPWKCFTYINSRTHYAQFTHRETQARRGQVTVLVPVKKFAF